MGNVVVLVLASTDPLRTVRVANEGEAIQVVFERNGIKIGDGSHLALNGNVAGKEDTVKPGDTIAVTDPRDNG